MLSDEMSSELNKIKEQYCKKRCYDQGDFLVQINYKDRLDYCVKKCMKKKLKI